MTGAASPLHYAVIFLTGAGTLALELLSSRVLTPYFGVSLYIWSSILSITLAFLAIGYFAGGWLAGRIDAVRCHAAFYVAPAISCLAIVIACLAYPWLFPWLASLDLVFGCIAAATILLAVPLVVLSAMNPLLISFRPAAKGDAGAGTVFFVSTLGSVAGVVATAFLLIPNMTNFRGLLLVALCLAAMPIAGLVPPSLERHNPVLLAASAIGLLAAGALFALAPAYLDKTRVVAAGGLQFTLRAEYSSMFGNLKIVDMADRRDTSRSLTLFLTDGLVQNKLAPDGTSHSEYTYALQALAAGYAPGARTALVLGLGAGIVPRDLAASGMAVDAVEINPDMLEAVRAFVTPDPPWTTHIGDARTFLGQCRRRYDLVVIDLFHGDGTPDYLLSADFFAAVRACMNPDGVAVMNAFASERASANYRHILATLRAVFGAVVDFHRPGTEAEPNLNAYLVASAAPRAPGPVRLDGVPGELRPGLVAVLDSIGTTTDAGDARPVTDEYNIFSILNLADQMAYRRLIVPQLPPQMLVN